MPYMQARSSEACSDTIYSATQISSHSKFTMFLGFKFSATTSDHFEKI